MTEYNFIADFLDTYQSLPDWLKALWLIVPSVFMLTLAALVMRFRTEKRRAGRSLPGTLVYTVHRDAENRLHITRNTRYLAENPVILLSAEDEEDFLKLQSHRAD